MTPPPNQAGSQDLVTLGRLRPRRTDSPMPGTSLPLTQGAPAQLAARVMELSVFLSSLGLLGSSKGHGVSPESVPHKLHFLGPLHS